MGKHRGIHASVLFFVEGRGIQNVKIQNGEWDG